ncbi:hypothetical protein [Qipengyuania sp. Mu-71]|jgi:hypothetical protein|uniref:hypothetical protein n=1 Tax=Qipengyuania sp. Mu-71 TaxID=3121477 RepID=UPI002FE46BC5
MMADAYDKKFADAVRRAAQGHPTPLAELLRSDVQMGTGERDLLALLIEGELARPAGRPAVGPGAPHIAAAILLYRNRKETFGEEAAAAEVANSMGRSKSTIREWDKMTREREAEIRKHSAFPEK